jgi:CheY-like chemotaxis protein
MLSRRFQVKQNKFLVIDDNPEFLEMIKQYSKDKKLAAEVIYFEDAFEGLYYITNNREDIDMVFTDLHMEKKGVSGVIIARKCQELNIPVYIVTGDTSPTIKVPVIPKASSMQRIVNIMTTFVG